MSLMQSGVEFRSVNFEGVHHTQAEEFKNSMGGAETRPGGGGLGTQGGVPKLHLDDALADGAISPPGVHSGKLVGWTVRRRSELSF